MSKRKSRGMMYPLLFMLEPVQAEVVYINDIVNLTYLPSKACYAGKLAESLEDKLKYIANRVGEHHESIIEHARLCILVSITKTKESDMIALMSGMRYLDVELVTSDDHITYIAIAGSIRGFKHLIRESFDQTNPILVAIKRSVYGCCYREFFVDMIDLGVMNDSFIDAIDSHPVGICNPLSTSNDNLVEILNIDAIRTIYDTLSRSGFTTEQCMNLASVTILFKDMSRVITQQLTRHRNAITQESQRYVNYSNVGFNNPADFKDKYDREKTYNITLETPVDGSVYINAAKLDEIGNVLCSIYGQLADQGLDKEDARAYLPNNAKSSKVFMTFTYQSLISFLKLRTDSHSQAEIRMYANIIYDAFVAYIKDLGEPFNEDIYYYLINRCMMIDNPAFVARFDIDEELSADYGEGTVDLTEELSVDEKENAELYKTVTSADYNPSKYSATRFDDGPPPSNAKKLDI